MNRTRKAQGKRRRKAMKKLNQQGVKLDPSKNLSKIEVRDITGAK